MKERDKRREFISGFSGSAGKLRMWYSTVLSARYKCTLESLAHDTNRLTGFYVLAKPAIS